MYTFKQKNSNSFLCFNVQSESLTYIDGFNNKEALMFSELLQAVNWLKKHKNYFNSRKGVPNIEDIELVSLSVNSLNANLKLICG